MLMLLTLINTNAYDVADAYMSLRIAYDADAYMSLRIAPQ